MGVVSSSLRKGHRYPAEVISHCLCLYHRFPLSFRAEIRVSGDLGVKRLADAQIGGFEISQKLAQVLVDGDRVVVHEAS
jgi:hypothetical protein